MPSCAMPWIVGRMISRITRACTFGVTTGAGEYAPMPPVLGPVSPSRSRLWSWLVASASTCVPSLTTMKLASSPSRNCSITRRVPAAPRLLCVIIWSIAACASGTLAATTTPLPAARPSALTTIGAPRWATKAFASSALSKVRCTAVGMPWRVMKLLAKSFDASSCAAARLGPKIFSPASRKASTMPAASGASGPTTVSWMFCFFAKAMSSATWVNGRFSRPPSVAVPPLPGATYTFCTRGPWASFQARACSRPPDPITRIFISVPEMPHAGEEHGDAALVGGGNHFGVAHAAAGLDHRRCAGVGERVQAAAEREERVRRGDAALELELGVLRFQGGDARAVEPAHLAGADAERGAAAAEHDGVRFNVLRHAPGEKQVAQLIFARLFAGHGFQLFFVQHRGIGALDEKPAAHALVVVRLGVMGEGHFEHAQIALAGKLLLRFGLDPRCDDHLGELLAHRLGGGAIERAV